MLQMVSNNFDMFIVQNVNWCILHFMILVLKCLNIMG